MPYISKELREKLGRHPTQINSAGELNYMVSRLAVHYLKCHGRSYQTMNDVVGALTGALAEFQRKVVAPYEDEKIKENGGIYG